MASDKDRRLSMSTNVGKRAVILGGEVSHYCESYPGGAFSICYKGEGYTTNNPHWILEIQCDGGTDSEGEEIYWTERIEISFCPFCGVPLKPEEEPKTE